MSRPSSSMSPWAPKHWATGKPCCSWVSLWSGWRSQPRTIERKKAHKRFTKNEDQDHRRRTGRLRGGVAMRAQWSGRLALLNAAHEIHSGAPDRQLRRAGLLEFV